MQRPLLDRGSLGVLPDAPPRGGHHGRGRGGNSGAQRRRCGGRLRPVGGRSAVRHVRPEPSGAWRLRGRDIRAHGPAGVRAGDDDRGGGQRGTGRSLRLGVSPTRREAIATARAGAGARRAALPAGRVDPLQATEDAAAGRGSRGRRVVRRRGRRRGGPRRAARRRGARRVPGPRDDARGLRRGRRHGRRARQDAAAARAVPRRRLLRPPDAVGAVPARVGRPRRCGHPGARPRGEAVVDPRPAAAGGDDPRGRVRRGAPAAGDALEAVAVDDRRGALRRAEPPLAVVAPQGQAKHAQPDAGPPRAAGRRPAGRPRGARQLVGRAGGVRAAGRGWWRRRRRGSRARVRRWLSCVPRSWTSITPPTRPL